MSMGSYCSSMNGVETQPAEFMGFNKHDLENGSCLQLTARINHLDEIRDNVRVEYPDERSKLLGIFINKLDISTELPGPIIQNECTYKVICGKRGKIIVKLRMTEAREWAKAWAPSRVESSQRSAEENEP